MSTTYISAVPLTVVRTVDAGYVNVYEGESISGDSVDPVNLERHVRKGFLVEKPADDEDDGKPTTVKAILAAVGDDKELAQVALDEENAAEKPRPSLVEKLQAIVDA